MRLVDDDLLARLDITPAPLEGVVAGRSFASIRQWYRHFAPVDDDEVAQLFAAHAASARADHR